VFDPVYFIIDKENDRIVKTNKEFGIREIKFMKELIVSLRFTFVISYSHK
jgi:hypothetical protein